MVVTQRHPHAYWPVVAAVCALGAFALTRSLDVLHEDRRLILFLAAVSIATALGRWRAGVLALLLSLLLYGIAYLPPLSALSLFDPDDGVRLGLFVTMALVIILLYASRERMQARLALSEQMLRLSLEAARMGAWSADFRTGEFWRSAGLSALVEPATQGAVSYEAFVGRIHPDDHTAFLRAVDRAIASNTGFDIRHRLLGAKAEARWVITRVRVSFDGSGRAQRLLGVSMEDVAQG
jgi:hypothetical protein